ncbi:MAG: protein TorT, partial [Saprospiraceae bacterium]
MISRLKHCLSFIVCLGISTPTFAVWDIVAWDPPLDYEGQTRSLMYQPIGEASQAWHLCVTYPHLKDPYWLSVNYGMVEEVKRLGVNMRVLEAGGYPQLATQVEQLSHCVDAASDAIIVG